MNDYLPTAKQMCELTDSILLSKLTKTYGQIKQEIIAAANKGDYFIYFDKTLPRPVVDHLKELGYHIRCENERNEVYYVISWSNRKEMNQ